MAIEQARPAANASQWDERHAAETGSPQVANKAVIRRFVEEVINRDERGALTELVSPAYVIHCPEGDLYGLDGARLDLEELRSAFPDLQLDINELVAEGDLVARHCTVHGTHEGPFLGLPPSHERVAMPAMGLDRVQDGQLVETWIAFNMLPLLTRVR